MGNERARIEHRFAHLKKKFAILDLTYRLSRAKFNTFFRICCALMNVELARATATQSFGTEATGEWYSAREDCKVEHQRCELPLHDLEL